MELRYKIFIVTIVSLFTSMFAIAYRYEIKVGEFSKLNVVNDLEVVYHCNSDSAGIAVLENCERGMASAVIFTNNGTLKIESSTDSEAGLNLPVVHVYSSFLRDVCSSSNKKVTIFSPAPTPEFNVKLYGNGEVKIIGISATNVKSKLMTGKGVISMSGKCENAKINITGTGEIRADELVANNVKCEILGTGSIYCHPLYFLKSGGIGSTRIYYKGNPEKIKKTGGGKLISLDNVQKNVE